jgi:phosphate transport system permease protein
MKLKSYFKSGEAWIWLNAAAVAICLIMVTGIISLIAYRGLSYFWPSDILQLEVTQDSSQRTMIGELYDTRTDPAAVLSTSGMNLPAGIEPTDPVTRWSLKMGNKDLGGEDFAWIARPFVTEVSKPEDMVKLERLEYGNLYGRLQSATIDGQTLTGETAWEQLEQAIKRSNELHEQIDSIESGKMNRVNYARTQVTMDERSLMLDDELTEAAKQELAARRAELQLKTDEFQQELDALYAQLSRDSAVFLVASGDQANVPVDKILEATKPNAMGVIAKTGHYFKNLWHFLSDNPREANTEGGVFPAIFGTVVMVFIMTIIVTPLGVVAAIYLREYAKQGRVTQLVRVAVNNLAGVPSIVYGVFGLGFFVYLIGGTIDDLFYPEAAPQPVFGTPGLLWASITLALLTLPVVIVATEEGLSRIPRNLKEGSLALGATKAETLWRVILPVVTPSMMTGMILAIARAAGEVAPLMLVGVVKLAPELPLDFTAPFLHLDRKFMHLGFHIYDVGFQSPDVEASRPLVYATSFLLVLVIALLNLTAIYIRNRLREKYKALES